MKKWAVLPCNYEKINKIIRSTDLAPLTVEVMSARGYNDIDRLKSFFDLEELSDPFLLPDMQKAVDAINEAVANGEIICVYGDFDCDGVTSTAILYDYLLNIGANTICYIPERSEGYGLNKHAVKSIAENGASLIVTVDNGISAIEEADYIYELGMKLVITDHHQPSVVLPQAEAVVDPYLDNCRSEFRDLAGVGVTLKLLAALDDGDFGMVVEQYADIAAIGTIADIVPLVSENRTIAAKGLSLIKNTENYGLIALMEESGVNSETITSTNVAFTLSPRINAAGRFGSPITALDMLVSEEDKSKELAHQLSLLNDKRKQAEADIFSELDKNLAQNPDIKDKRVMVVSGENWHHGIIGIVASRLLEIYGKPVVVISKDSDGTARGSARSIKGFNIFKCFEYCKELLIKYGGHECAGGLTVLSSNIDELDSMIQEYAAQYHPHMPKYTLTADKLIKGRDITLKNISDLKRLEPFGAENSEPLFAFSGAKILSVVPLKNGEHTRLDIEYDGVKLKALLFRRKTATIELAAGDIIDIMGNLQINSFRGIDTVSLIIQDYRLHGIKQDRFFAAIDAYEAFKRREPLPEEYLQKAVPTREVMAKIYKSISSAGVPLTRESLYARLLRENINAFKLYVVIEAFCELGLASIDGKSGIISLNKADKKVDIMSAPIIKHLCDFMNN